MGYHTLMPALIFCVLLLFVSCGQKQQVQKESGFSSIESLAQQKPFDRAKLSDQEVQAKYSDIPVPIGFSCFNDEKSAQAHLMSYEGSLALEKVRIFYLQEMERLGWQITDVSTATELLFWCDKTSKQCAISVRLYSDEKRKSKTHIYCFIKTKSFSLSKPKEWFDDE